MKSTEELVKTYFDAWQARDFATYRSVLADDVEFVGALGTTSGADETVRGIEGMSRIMTEVVIHKMWIDGPDALTWFDLHTSLAPPCPVANWSHAENGKITRIRVTFDPRPLLPPTGA